MVLAVILFFVGLFLLYIGAELLVGGSSRIALMLRISPIIVGLTVVAFGTSSPEFLVSFMAAYRGSIDVSVGNIVGSNIANIALVLGLSAFLRPIMHVKDDIRGELHWMMGATLLFAAFAYNLKIDAWEGMILFIGILVFTGLLIRQSIKERNREQKPKDLPSVSTGYARIDGLSKTYKLFIFSLATIGGIAVLALGSKVTIDSATTIARNLGISEVVIGLTMVAFGTSLPELATGIISVIKKENEILVGNVIGSNIFNIFGVAGPIAMFFSIPLKIHVVHFDFPIMLIFTGILYFYMLWRPRVARLPAGLLLLSYIFFIVRTFWAQ